jgi:hypothetical protein
MAGSLPTGELDVEATFGSSSLSLAHGFKAGQMLGLESLLPSGIHTLCYGPQVFLGTEEEGINVVSQRPSSPSRLNFVDMVAGASCRAFLGMCSTPGFQGLSHLEPYFPT